MTNELTNRTASEELVAALQEAVFEANRDEHEGEPLTAERLARTGALQHFIAYELRMYGRTDESVKARANEWDCAP